MLFHLQHVHLVLSERAHQHDHQRDGEQRDGQLEGPQRFDEAERVETEILFRARGGGRGLLGDASHQFSEWME